MLIIGRNKQDNSCKAPSAGLSIQYALTTY